MASEFLENFFSEYFLKHFKNNPNKITQLLDPKKDSFDELKEKIKVFLCDYIDSNYYVDDYLKNFDAIRTCYLCMGDHYSRGLYLRELIGRLSFDIIGSAMGNQLAGHDSEQVFNNKIAYYYNKLELDKLYKTSDKEKNKNLGMLSAYYWGLKQYLYEAPFLDEPVTVGPDEGDVCIDIGSAYGETAIWMLKERKASFVHAFDLSDYNIQSFNTNIENLGLQDKAKCYQYAISNKNEDLLFIKSAVNSTQDSVIKDDGALNKENAVYIKGIKLDDFCHEHNIKPQFIKADIEGFELFALQGAAEIIKEFKPKIAFSAYHRRNDLFTLPLYLHELNPNYKFYLKRYHPYWELVLFAKNFE